MLALAEPITEIEVAEKNYRFLQNSKHIRKLYLFGGAGSAKSWSIAIFLLLERLFPECNVNLLCVRKTRPDVEDSCFKLFRNLLDAWEVPYKYNLTKLLITLPNGNEIHCIGLDRVEKKKSYEGINYVWGEEGIELTKKEALQLNLRCRAKNVDGSNQIILSYNPVDIYSWVKDETDAPDDDEHACCHSTYKDNPFLSAEEVHQIKLLKDKDTVYDAIYARGEYASPTNVIYTNWQIKEISQAPHDYDDASGGLDFGFNSATALLLLGLRDENVYIVRELYGRGWTNTDLISKMKTFWQPSIQIIADSAEPDRIKEIMQAGFRCTKSKKGKNSVTAGIDWLRARKIYIHPSCVNTIKEFRMYKYKEDAAGRVFEEPVAYEDHACDGVRYGCDPWRQAILSVVATKRL